MTLGQLARIVQPNTGNRQYIHNIERGASLPSVGGLARLADYFDVPIDFFFTKESDCPACGCTGGEVV